MPVFSEADFTTFAEFVDIAAIALIVGSASATASKHAEMREFVSRMHRDTGRAPSYPFSLDIRKHVGDVLGTPGSCPAITSSSRAATAVLLAHEIPLSDWPDDIRPSSIKRVPLAGIDALLAACDENKFASIP